MPLLMALAMVVMVNSSTESMESTASRHMHETTWDVEELGAWSHTELRTKTKHTGKHIYRLEECENKKEECRKKNKVCNPCSSNCLNLNSETILKCAKQLFNDGSAEIAEDLVKDFDDTFGKKWNRWKGKQQLSEDSEDEDE